VFENGVAVGRVVREEGAAGLEFGEEGSEDAGLVEGAENGFAGRESAGQVVATDFGGEGGFEGTDIEAEGFAGGDTHGGFSEGDTLGEAEFTAECEDVRAEGEAVAADAETRVFELLVKSEHSVAEAVGPELDVGAKTADDLFAAGPGEWATLNAGEGLEAAPFEENDVVFGR